MTGPAVAFLLAATALILVRGPAPVVARLRVLQGRPIWARPSRPALPVAGVGVAAPALGGALALGGWSRLGFGVPVPVVPALAGAIAGGTAAVVLARAAADRGRRREAAALVESVGALTADLRAGQRPAVALAAPGAGPAAAERPVGAAGAVSARGGAAPAPGGDRGEGDRRARPSQDREVTAQLAGARSTAALLAALPALGIALGAAMGARPLAVLLGDARGQAALLTGVGLDAVGVLWTSRIVAAAGGPR